MQYKTQELQSDYGLSIEGIVQCGGEGIIEK